MKKQSVLFFFVGSYLFAHPNPTYMPLYEVLLNTKGSDNSSGSQGKGKKEKSSFLDKIFSSAKCESADEEREEFSFDNQVRRKPEYSQEEEMDNLIGRFCRLCQQRDGEGIPQSEFVGLAREMVNSDDAYKAEQSHIKWILFKYPWIKYAGTAAGSALVGALAHFAFS